MCWTFLTVPQSVLLWQDALSTFLVISVLQKIRGLRVVIDNSIKLLFLLGIHPHPCHMSKLFAPRIIVLLHNESLVFVWHVLPCWFDQAICVDFCDNTCAHCFKAPFLCILLAYLYFLQVFIRLWSPCASRTVVWTQTLCSHCRICLNF
jgi:hypothetical protein